MIQDHLALILDNQAAKPDKEGWSVLTEGRTLTLYVSHDGASLTVSRVEAVMVKGGLLRARTAKGELYFLALEDVFCAAAETPPAQGRRAGFV
jgi:hypothetical protein